MNAHLAGDRPMTNLERRLRYEVLKASLRLALFKLWELEDPKLFEAAYAQFRSHADD